MSSAQTVLKLYNGAIPNEVAGPDKESSKEGKAEISNITRPTLEVFLPVKQKANATAVTVSKYLFISINNFLEMLICDTKVK